MQKYKYIATTKIEEFISPSSNIQSDDISTYYASIVNALLDSKNIYTKIIDDLKKTAELLKTTSADHNTHHAIFTNKTLINAKWIEHTMKEAITNLMLLTSKTNKISKTISQIQDIAEHINLLVLHTSVNIAKNGYSDELAFIMADRAIELAESAENINKDIDTVI